MPRRMGRGMVPPRGFDGPDTAVGPNEVRSSQQVAGLLRSSQRPANLPNIDFTFCPTVGELYFAASNLREDRALGTCYLKRLDGGICVQDGKKGKITAENSNNSKHAKRYEKGEWRDLTFTVTWGTTERVIAVGPTPTSIVTASLSVSASQQSPAPAEAGEQQAGPSSSPALPPSAPAFGHCLVLAEESQPVDLLQAVAAARTRFETTTRDVPSTVESIDDANEDEEDVESLGGSDGGVPLPEGS